MEVKRGFCSLGYSEVIPITGIFKQNVNVQEGQKTKYSQRGISGSFQHLCRFANTFAQNAALRSFVLISLSEISGWY